jgi:hypothetical protein
MPYDEERDELNRDFHRPTRDRWNPDGTSAPVDCEHPRTRILPGFLGETGTRICLSCGMMFWSKESKP